MNPKTPEGYYRQSEVECASTVDFCMQLSIEQLLLHMLRRMGKKHASDHVHVSLD